jgi:hypothetical protein
MGPPNIEAAGPPAVGRSGGGLFNESGELVAICNFADPAGNEGIYSALASIHAELDRIKLSEIYLRRSIEKDDALQPIQTVAGETRTLAEPPLTIFRGQDPLPSSPAAGDDVVRNSTGPTALAEAPRTESQAANAAPIELTPSERAAWEELMQRTSESEVVCIVRPLDPHGKSEVIVLDRVSPQFVRKLLQQPPAEPRRAAPETALGSPTLEVPDGSGGPDSFGSATAAPATARSAPATSPWGGLP